MQLVANRDHTPALAHADRELLGDTLRSLRRVIGEYGGAEQVLHQGPGTMITVQAIWRRDKRPMLSHLI
jgi:hypothetical protein